MRDFHKVMAESNAVLKYNSDHIVIQLNITSLETLKEIADIIIAEFDCEPKSVSVVPESGAIVLKVPCLNNTTYATCSCGKHCSCEAETETEEDTSLIDFKADYNNKILTTAIEVLREKGALTPTELEQELAKRGVVAPSTAIGRALASSGIVIKIGRHWKIKKDVADAETDPEENGWKQLTKRGYYKIDGDDVVIGFKNGDGEIIHFKRVPLQVLEEIYEKLPKRTGAQELAEIATEHGLKMSNFHAYYMRILADIFSGEVETESGKLVLVKGDSNGSGSGE